MEHAYVVGHVRLPDPGAPTPVLAFGVFGEKTPTTMGVCLTFVLHDVAADTYGEALRRAKALMNDDARFVRMGEGSRASWRLADTAEFTARIRDRIKEDERHTSYYLPFTRKFYVDNGDG